MSKHYPQPTIIGSGLITKDREENGLALYFARPLGLRDYILGKGLITLFYYFAVTLFPVLALCIFGYLSTQGATGLQMLVATPLRALVYCTLAGTSFSLVLLALSSMGTRTVFVALWWVLLFATEGLAEIMAMFRPELRILDFAGQHTNMGALILGGRSMTGVSPWVSLAVVLGRCDPCPVALPRSYIEATPCVEPYDPSTPLFEYLPRSCTEACPQESTQVCLSAIGQAVCRGDGICVVVQ